MKCEGISEDALQKVDRKSRGGSDITVRCTAGERYKIQDAEVVEHAQDRGIQYELYLSISLGMMRIKVERPVIHCHVRNSPGPEASWYKSIAASRSCIRGICISGLLGYW